MEELTIIHLFFLSILLFLLYTIRYAWHFIAYKKYIHLQTKILARLHTQDLPVFYSSYFLKKEINRQIFHLKPKRKHAVFAFAIKKNVVAIPQVKQILKSNPNDIPLLLLASELSVLENNFSQAEKYFHQINMPYFIPSILKNKYLFIKAKLAFYQTDMKTAFFLFQKVAKYYNRPRFFTPQFIYRYEYAETLCALAQLYRILSVSDTAISLFYEARKIYEKLNLPAKLIEIDSHIGIIHLNQKNYKEAQEYLNIAAAKALAKNFSQTHADICNWLGMLHFQQEHHTLANNFFSQAYTKSIHAQAKAFAAEMLARITYQTNQPSIALRYVQKSIMHNKKILNQAGIFDNVYLKAEIYYQLNDYKKSRRLLTYLIKNFRSTSSTYYPAQAYTLLGLIETAENHLEMAQTLFKQAADIEYSQKRLKGAMIDYQNLAEISQRLGQTEDAENYRRQALKLMHDISKEEPKDIIKQTSI